VIEVFHGLNRIITGLIGLAWLFLQKGTVFLPFQSMPARTSNGLLGFGTFWVIHDFEDKKSGPVARFLIRLIWGINPSRSAAAR
jgi:hypothetical protein